jgi:hypothetical protein
LAIAADLSVRTSDIVTWIVFTFAIFALSSGWAGHILAGISFAFAFDADIALRTSNAVTRPGL